MKKLFFFIAVFVLCSTAFAKDGVDSLISPGDLAKAHAKYEGIRNCTQCHKLGGGVPEFFPCKTRRFYIIVYSSF